MPMGLGGEEIEQMEQNTKPELEAAPAKHKP